jgi:1-acyl-sn-glycerol-3-phosphate acyltransferase
MRLPRERIGVRRLEPWYQFAVFGLRPPVTFWFNWRFEGMEHVPPEGPALIAANHISYFDPLAHAYFLVKAHRIPRYLAKSELYENWFLKRLLEGAHQIKVYRGTGDSAPLENGKKALADGECVVIYPESTVTTNPDFSPMKGKTGIARLTLSTNVPVLPIAVWGSQHVWQRDGARSLKFGRPIWLKAGPPLDFSEYSESAKDEATFRTVTDHVMDELTGLVEDLRSRYPKRWQ